MKATAKPTNQKKKKVKISRRELMPWLIIAGVIAIILAGAAIYTAIESDSFRKVYTVTYNGDDGSYYDQEQGITYVPAPFCYEAVLNATADYPYAKMKIRWNPFDATMIAKEKLNTFYQVGYKAEDGVVHLRPGTEWFCRSKELGGQVFYNPDRVDFPEMSEFDWNVIYFTNPDSSQFSTYTLDEKTTDKLMKQFTAEDAENVYKKVYGVEELDIKLTLKVSSNTYQWLYLNLNLVEDTKGNYYLYPEGSSNEEDCRMIRVDNAYFEDYLSTLEDMLGGTVKE